MREREKVGRARERKNERKVSGMSELQKRKEKAICKKKEWCSSDPKKRRWNFISS